MARSAYRASPGRGAPTGTTDDAREAHIRRSRPCQRGAGGRVRDRRQLAPNHRRGSDRDPKETLLFFSIRPEMRVLEVWPEPGWYTEVIAPLVREKGKYYAAVIAADPHSKYVTERRSDYQQKLASQPAVYGGVEV